MQNSRSRLTRFGARFSRRLRQPSVRHAATGHDLSDHGEPMLAGLGRSSARKTSRRVVSHWLAIYAPRLSRLIATWALIDSTSPHFCRCSVSANSCFYLFSIPSPRLVSFYSTVVYFYFTVFSFICQFIGPATNHFAHTSQTFAKIPPKIFLECFPIFLSVLQF